MPTTYYPTLFQHLATDYQRNLSVTAGAGTGKTEVLTRRIINIVAEEKYTLDRLLVLTFTDKAAVEMKERIYAAVEKELARTGEQHFQRLKDSFLNNYISTFHAFCAALLREYPIEAGLDPSFRVLDETEKVFFLRRSINRSLKELAADKNNRDINLLSEDFSRAVLGSAIFSIIQKREETGSWITTLSRLEWKDYLGRLQDYRSCILQEICYKFYINGRVRQYLQALKELDSLVPDDQSAFNRRRRTIISKLTLLLEETGRVVSAVSAETEYSKTSLPPGSGQGQERPFLPAAHPSPAGTGAGEDSTGDDLEIDVLSIAELKHEILDNTKMKGSAPATWPDEAVDSLRNSILSLRYLLQSFPIEEFEITEEHEKTGFEILQALARVVLYCLERYNHDKAGESYLDFQDLQIQTINLLTGFKHRHILKELRERFQFIMVDEFQDTNDLQWQIIKKIAADQSEALVNARVFVVGDEKQAIYSFRGGDVRLFSRVRKELMEVNCRNKLHLRPFNLQFNCLKDYSTEYREKFCDDSSARAGEIVFADNFRSASFPIRFFNMFFLDLLCKDVYEEYDAKPQELLCSGNKASGSVELLLVDSAVDAGAALGNLPRENGSAVEFHERELKPHFKEALLIADRIKEVFLGDDERHRRVRESAREGRAAVAILLNRRTMIKTYEEALRLNRIDFTVVRGRGFFQRQEVVDLGNLLSFLHDPSDELSLVAFLRSPAGHVSDEGIFLLSKIVQGTTLWEKLQRIGRSAYVQERELFSVRDQSALAHAYLNLCRWYDLAGRRPLVEFLRQVLREGGYYVSLSRGNRGEQAVSNMEKLLDSARDLQLQEGADLADFVVWLNNRIDYIEEEGEADIDISLGGAVQIMTVHQSKGLEFPMVFVPDLGAGFNLGEREQLYADLVPYQMNIDGDSIIRKEKPEIGINAANPQNEWESEPILIKRIMKNRLRDKLIAEKKRLFYVAATRAMDHLVLVGHSNFMSDNLVRRLRYMPLDMLSNWMDWLNQILGLSFKIKGSRGKILYQNEAGEEIAIPYRMFSDEAALLDPDQVYRTEFPLPGQAGNEEQ